MEKKVLIIDNEVQTEEIEKLERDALHRGLKVKCYEFNVGSTSHPEFLTSGHIDVDKVVEEYNKQYHGITFSLAAFDWDLSDDHVDGVELVRQFRAKNILVDTPKFLYSGLIDEKLREKIGKLKKGEITSEEFLKSIKTLINIDFLKFVKREDYDQEIITILSKKCDSLDLIVENWIKKHPDMVFAGATSRASLKGKKLGEIWAEGDRDPRIKDEFKQVLFSEVTSYLIKLEEN